MVKGGHGLEWPLLDLLTTRIPHITDACAEATVISIHQALTESDTNVYCACVHERRLIFILLEIHIS